jgi:hypothetical protein
MILAHDQAARVGPDHRDTLVARDHLADWTGKAGGNPDHHDT